MQKTIYDLLDLQNTCTLLCVDLIRSLEAERHALIELKMEELLENNLVKESLHTQLKAKRTLFQSKLGETFGVAASDELELLLNGPLKYAWVMGCKRWQGAWENTRRQCESNQRFMKHSLKNMGMLVENLRRLFGDSQLYSAQGRRVESQNQGKVVEASY